MATIPRSPPCILEGHRDFSRAASEKSYPSFSSFSISFASSSFSTTIWRILIFSLHDFYFQVRFNSLYDMETIFGFYGLTYFVHLKFKSCFFNRPARLPL
jgi:hypothetical protein